MIRGMDDNGCLFVGFTRDQLERMLAGERVCCNAVPPHAPGPHLCFFAAEDNAALLRLMDKAYPDTEPHLPIGHYPGHNGEGHGK